MRKKSHTIPLSWIVGVAIPLLTFFGGILLKVWSVADNIATKGELSVLREDVIANFKRTDEAIAKSVDAAKRYTDEKATQTKQESFDHSDKNKLGMDSKYAELDGKFGVILNLLNDIRMDRGKHR